MGFLGGPFSKTLAGKGCLAVWNGVGWFFCKIRAPRLPDLLDHKMVVPAVIALVLIDPFVVWHFSERDEVEEGYSLWRDVARTNPLRMQCLDRAVANLANLGSEEHQDLAAANSALVKPGPAQEPIGSNLYLPNRRHRRWPKTSLSSRSRA